jgi:Zn-dependent protease
MPGALDFDVQRIMILLVSIIIAVTVHEFMHAWTAWRLGDDTARLLGRISLNPAVHFDPLGFILFVLLAFGIGFLAWGKPVPVNMYRLRPLGPLGRKGSMALVAFAGPLSNVVLAAVAALTLSMAERSGADLGGIGLFLEAFLGLNLLLAAFNMIPIPPLDGSKILVGILPNFWYPILAPLERYGFVVLLLLMFLGGSFGGSILGSMIAPVYQMLDRIISYL